MRTPLADSSCAQGVYAVRWFHSTIPTACKGKCIVLFDKMTLSSNVRLVVQRSAGSRRAMSASAKVWIDKDTRVICQGFTGKQVRTKRVIV